MASFKSSIFGILTLILIFIAAAAADNCTSSEQHLKVEFVVDLDVLTLDPAGYIAFQDDLRKRLAARYIGPADNNVAVLRPKNEIAPPWFDLKLKSYQEAHTTVRFRADNLYLIGYQMGTTWFEFGNPNKGDKVHKIPNSQFLGFRGDYLELERAAGKLVTQVPLTKHSFAAAVKTLAKSTKGNERAEALILLIQMVSEACRFVVLSNDFSAQLLSDEAVYLQQWMKDDLENKWEGYSKILLCYDKFGNKYNFPKPTINQNVIATADELRKKLGMLLNVQVDKKVCKITANDVELPSIIDFLAQVQNPVALAGVEA